MEWTPLYLSIQLAAVVTVLLLVLAAPLAYFLAYYRFPGKSLMETLLYLPTLLQCKKKPVSETGFAEKKRFLERFRDPDGG